MRHFIEFYTTLNIVILLNIKRYSLFSYNINSLFLLLMLSKKINIIINKIYIGVSQILVSLHTYYIFLPSQRLKNVITFKDFKRAISFLLFQGCGGASAGYRQHYKNRPLWQ